MIATLLVSEDGWPDAWLLSIFVGILLVQSQAAHPSSVPCCQNKAAAMIIPPAMIQRASRYILTFKSKIIGLSKMIPEPWL